MVEREKIGTVFTYFSKVGAAAINLSDGGLSIGDTIQIQGATTDLTFKLDSMQIDKQSVEAASEGQSIGLKVGEKVRIGDEVYKL